MSESARQVSVDVTTGWTSPDAPRDIDALAVADVPDVPSWLAGLDALGTDARLDLHGRTLTQLVAGEPADIVEEAGDWVRVVAPWQPSPLDDRGYPVWVRRSHLGPRMQERPVPPGDGVEPDPRAIVAAARRHLGLPYLWGGTSPYGLDCSGLVHHSYRRAGIVVPRDAHAQHETAEPVAAGHEQPGDLYFFAKPNGWVYHVGFVTEGGAMLHAPETGRGVEEAPMSPERAASLFATGRFRV